MDICVTNGLKKKEKTTCKTALYGKIQQRRETLGVNG